MSYTIRKRFLVKDEGWRVESYEVEGTFQDAGKEASGAAKALDDRFGNDHFWTVDLVNAKGESYFQLFHGRLE